MAKCGVKKGNVPHNKGKSKGWIDSNGYRQLKINGKNVREHRYLMELHIGRKLDKTEDIHHINGIKTDNRIENLQIINHSEHTKITNKRVYKKGYKVKISESERQRRSNHMKKIRINNAINKATK